MHSIDCGIGCLIQYCRLYEALKPVGAYDSTDAIHTQSVKSDVDDNELPETNRTDELQCSECIYIPNNNDEQ